VPDPRGTFVNASPGRLSLTAPTLTQPALPEPEPEPRRNWWEGDPAELTLIPPGAAPSSILTVRNFLSAWQCALIRQAFEVSRTKLSRNPVDSFWDDRVLWFDQIDEGAPAAKAVMQQARFVIGYRLAEHFGVGGRLYSDSQQLVLWKEGQEMRVHVDNAHPDGAQHNTPHRDFAAVLYLNDAFEGGEIYFPLEGIRIRPSTGLLIGFRGSSECPHGVTTVRSGERFTMPCWYSLNPKVAEASMFKIF
jgi:predicted 2-oxoglutarate/Fe(II)-dependent dioxygenase YbiX